VPRTVWPTAKDTDPVGEPVPEAAFTVAVNTVELPALMLATLAVTIVVVAIGWLLFQSVTRLYTSTEPKPVA
jgi:hypothetical protein